MVDSQKQTRLIEVVLQKKSDLQFEYLCPISVIGSIKAKNLIQKSISLILSEDEVFLKKTKAIKEQ